MKVIFEVYELHSMKYEVEAETLAEAVELYKDGCYEIVDDSQTFIEVAEEYGNSLKSALKFANQEIPENPKLGEIDLDEELLGIRSVEIEE